MFYKVNKLAFQSGAVGITWHTVSNTGWTFIDYFVYLCIYIDTVSVGYHYSLILFNKG